MNYMSHSLQKMNNTTNQDDHVVAAKTRKIAFVQERLERWAMSPGSAAVVLRQVISESDYIEERCGIASEARPVQGTNDKSHTTG